LVSIGSSSDNPLPVANIRYACFMRTASLLMARCHALEA
jgi:hypothetical protein